jgi:hypothetical protein
MSARSSISLMTATWSGDLDHYRILVHSIAKSPLADLPHTTVVQTEDLAAFSALQPHQRGLISTEDVLPKEIEQGRLGALKYQKLLGRHGTRISGSLCRDLGWPSWPRYTGWHTQQLSKLALAAKADTDYVLAIDSDVAVTPAADLEQILAHPGIVCFSQTQPLSAFSDKTRKWVLQADSLLRVPAAQDEQYDCYFDTPFLLHTATVRAMLEWLENEYQQPWWKVLLNQPPRRWSEFATYKLFLKKQSLSAPDKKVLWLAPDKIHYIFDASDTKKLLSQLNDRWSDPNTHFVTIHSQSSGRKLWSAADFADQVIGMI